jgi:hypothetical protein
MPLFSYGFNQIFADNGSMTEENLASETGYKAGLNRKIWVPILVCVALVGGIGIVRSNHSTDAGVTPVEIYKPKGEMVIPPQFESPSFFQNGMADYSTRSSDTPIFTGGGSSGDPLKFNMTEDLYGLISADGKITAPLFKMVGSFENGLAPAESEGNLYGAVDSNGKWIINPRFYWLSNFADGLAPFAITKNSKYGYINTKGKVIIPPKWDSAYVFKEERAMVCDDFIEGISQKCGFINLEGNLITKMEFSSYTSHSFSEGFARVCKGLDSKMKCGFIDRSGKVVDPIETAPVQNEYGDWLPYTSDFIGGYAIFGGQWWDGIQKWGLVNKKFETQIEAIFTKELSKYSTDPWDFDAGVQWQTVGRTKDNPGRSAAVDIQGKVLFYSNYDEVQQFTNGISPVRIGNKWGFINQKNQMVIKPQFDETRGYSEGLAAVRIGRFWGYIN